MPELSTVEFPQLRKTLKRSASTASLPTPPRTHRKRGRGRSRGSCDSDSDDSVTLPSGTDERCTERPNKKRRTEAVVDDEDAFWLGGPRVVAGAPSKTNGLSQSVPLLYRKSAMQTDVAPVSPPPSHRKRGAKKTPSPVVTPKISPMLLDKGPRIASPPSTPKRQRPLTRSALKDSPENPFLATPVADSDSPTESSANPSPRTPSYDKPYITYVFRGSRRTYQNPHYNHAEGRPLSPLPASKLPMDHPDYSPSEICPPKRLFPKTNAGPGYLTRSKSQKRRSLSSSSNEGAGIGLELRPKKLDFKESGNKTPGKRPREAAGGNLLA